MLKQIRAKLSLEDRVDANLDELRKRLKARFNLEDTEVKIFSRNCFEIIFPIIHGMDQLISILDDIIVYLRES
ncbi:MAG: hypothetical protein OdinLCB4_004355 [Candidatus Odinarchaeum yellowstonii]|uniref:Uncharacterized protein n=1 Tax=Odinarchaeota yellowstonii (strain LCB_4) TaxID=1841599 RepID=A0AAF0D142_ODILC|nr:MAG: hypothetical protein OdinLCB4_004355 [Candidatus Odinarchaeum yellowstonii]